jgi:DNA-directed RNA polymerase subunit omega
MISTKDLIMARVTNSDTLPFVDSRYELGMLASQRVRDLNGGAEAVVEKNNDKLTVVALREIASGKLDVADVRHEFVQSYKDAPAAIEEDASLEIASEDPMLREIDAELENSLMDDAEPTDNVAEEDDTPDASEGEE